MNPDVYDENPNIRTMADAIGYYYKGKKIQVYWADTGGNTNYSDFQTATLLYAEGKVLWGNGDVFALECDVETPNNDFKTVVLFNSYNMYMITPLDGVDIMHIFKGRLKKNKSKGI